MNTTAKYASLCILALTLAHNAYSASYHSTNPFYLGAELGGCDLHYRHTPDAVSVDDQGFAGRLIAGVDVNPNLALELGYTLYQNPEFKYFLGQTTDFSQQSVDFLAKVSLPVSCNMNLYAKAGLSYVHRDDAEIVSNNVIIKINDSDDHLRPMLGVGVSYEFNRKVSGTVGYYRTFGSDDLGDADFYGAGLTFKLS